MKKLEELEYVLVHRGGRGLSFVYELLYQGEGQDGSPFLMGLIDVDELKHACDEKKEHREKDQEPSKDNLEVSSRSKVALKAALGRVLDALSTEQSHSFFYP